MKRGFIATLAVGALLAAVPAQADAKTTRYLSQPDAKVAIWDIAERKIPWFEFGPGRIYDCKRLSRSRVRCAVESGISDRYGKGKVTSWRSTTNSRILTKGKVKLLDLQCLRYSGKPKSMCKRTKRWGPQRRLSQPADTFASGLPKLVGPDAKQIVKSALRRKYDGAYTHGFSKKINCNRVSRTRIRCKIRFAIGDNSYKGYVTAWIARRRGAVRAFDSGRVKTLSVYCMVTGGTKKSCTTVERWR